MLQMRFSLPSSLPKIGRLTFKTKAFPALLLLGAILLTATFTKAQGGPVLPLKEKTVAVYFSKKHFAYNRFFYHDLSQFIKTHAGENVQIQDAKLQSIIAFGSLFSNQLAEATRADSAFFLNAYPDLARVFIKSYDADGRTLAPLGNGMPGIDYILVVNPMSLVMKRVPAVLAKSNRLETTYDMVKTGRLSLDIIEPKTGRLAGSYEVCVNDHKTRIPESLFAFYPYKSRMGDFLGKLFSTLIHHVNLGEPGNCETAPEPDPDGEEDFDY